jgi:glucose uptake protein
MSFAIGLLPALLFGSSSVLLMKLGGDSRQQTMGQFLGALAVAIVLALSVGVDTNPAVLLTAFVAGAVLGVGMNLQIISFHYLGVSRVMPLTTGGQLIGVAVLGIALFGEWVGSAALPVGIAALAAILVGVFLAGWSEPDALTVSAPADPAPADPAPAPASAPASASASAPASASASAPASASASAPASASASAPASASVRTGMVIMAISTLFLIAFPTLTRLWSIDPMTSLLPEAIGFVVVGVIATSPRRGMPDTRWSRPTVGALLPGVLWGTGLIVLQYSINVLGVAVGFALSQLTVVVATFGGIWILQEKKTRKEMRVTMLGMLFLVGGAMLLGYANALDGI